MMGRNRLEWLKTHADSLTRDGIKEGALLTELAQELERLRKMEWTNERLLDGLDTLAAIWLTSAEGQQRSMGDLTLLELIQFAGQRVKSAAAMPASAIVSPVRGWKHGLIGLVRDGRCPWCLGELSGGGINEGEPGVTWECENGCNP